MLEDSPDSLAEVTPEATPLAAELPPAAQPEGQPNSVEATAVAPQAPRAAIAKPMDFLPGFRPSRRQHRFALLVIALALLFFRAQALPVFSTHYLGGAERDAGLYLWLMQRPWSLAELLPWGSSYFDLGTFYPYGSGLAYSDNYLLPTLAYRILALLFSPIVSVNLLLLAATFASGYFTYLLCFRFCARQEAALFGALVFMGYSFLSLHLGHPQLQYTFWLPLCFLQLTRAIAGRSVWQFFFFGLALAGCFLTTVYYAVFIGMLSLAFVALCAFVRPQNFFNWRMLQLGVAASLGLALVYPWVPPYLEVRQIFGARALYEAHSFAPTSLSFLSAPPHSALYAFLQQLSGVGFSSNPEAMLFPGCVLLVLAAMALRFALACPQFTAVSRAWACLLVVLFAFSTRALPGLSDAWQCALAACACWGALLLGLLCLKRLAQHEQRLGFSILTNRDLVLIFVWLALLTFTLALGPLADEASAVPSFSPFRIAYWLLPGFDALRAIGRIAVLWCFCLGIASALFLARLLNSGGISKRALIALTLLAALENLHLDYPRESEVPAPAAMQYLQSLPEAQGSGNSRGSALIVLPLSSKLTRDGRVASWSDFAFHNVRAMRWSAASADRALVNGYSGQRPKLQTELARRLRNFPDQASLRALRQIVGLRYVLHLGEYDPRAAALSFEQRLLALPGALKELYHGPDASRLFELRGGQMIDPQFVLYIPPRKNQVLELSLKVNQKGPQPPGAAQLKLQLEDGNALRLIREEPLAPSEKQHRVSILLREDFMADGVRPLRMRFVVPTGYEVLLEDSWMEKP